MTTRSTAAPHAAQLRAQDADETVDALLAGAVEVARASLLADVDPVDVGEHLGVLPEGDGVATHLFACRRPGYRGWRWSVTVAAAPGQREVTVDEVVLLPGDDAVVAPPWVPYRERIRPGDLSPGDLLPVDDDDPRLVPTWSFGDDDLDPDAQAQVREVARELGLGRVRTLGPDGRALAAQRWYDGAAGPSAPVAQAAPDHCWSCGFLVRLAGPLSGTFGVCGNGDANDDGRVVSLDHGCGAHSEVRLAKRYEPVPPPPPVLDTLTDDVVLGL
ncbi:DUF3027 domain-containing protein [Nocardioides sp. TRM66260-LWL]|uniref:DUF3027 domain-containing protein n=1 Tax=Nocardioides sp. TRM66260-LWL TaxID=2874478 RepID=UPI001CC53141|nr:DUF3027 domain-containing protein [Nocardioides sp. TRM66260-LWL]MBZ5734544.1 DUF3027 domain-containing protein [Nocardioides sp. TRM66260-LWL]